MEEEAVAVAGHCGPGSNGASEGCQSLPHVPKSGRVPGSLQVPCAVHQTRCKL